MEREKRKRRKKENERNAPVLSFPHSISTFFTSVQSFSTLGTVTTRMPSSILATMPSGSTSSLDASLDSPTPPEVLW